MLSASIPTGDPSVLHGMSSESHFLILSLLFFPLPPSLWFSEKDLRRTSESCFIEKEGSRASHSCHLCQMVSAHGLLRKGSMSDSTTKNRKK